MTTRQHPVYSKDATVHLVTGPDKRMAMERAIEQAGLLAHVEALRSTSGKQPSDFLIAIKPNIMTASIREKDSPVYTDPELVELLIDRLGQHGYGNVAVVESHNVYDYSYTGRTVAAVAEMVGYSARTYRIVDLSEEKVPFDYGGVLGRHVVGRTWSEADYRISFAKNKTHWQCFYTGCMKNIYGCLPEWDKMKHYHGKGREFYECCILILDAFPVHFGFLDAWVSGDGFTGHVRDAKPNCTRTIFASDNVLALDWVMGEKMGLDPARNSVVRQAINRWGNIEITRQGDLTRWHPWTNVRPCTVAALDLLEEAYWLSRFFSRVFANLQDPRFPAVPRLRRFFRILQRMSRWFERVFEVRT